ncbi:MAG TPA: hypothetical protein VGK33_05295 [Chloroflexota bacterium]
MDLDVDTPFEFGLEPLLDGYAALMDHARREATRRRLQATNARGSL